MDGHYIKGAPHHITVREGTEPGLSGIDSFTLTVAATDEKGDRKTGGGDAFEVTISGPDEYPVHRTSTT